LLQRPFRILGVQQIAVGGLDRARLHRLWVDLLGVPSRGEFRNVVENVEGELATIGAGPFAVDLNILEPLDPERSPRAHQPPLNHVGLWVDDMPAAITWLTARGLTFTERGIRDGAAGYDVCFIHPKHGGEGVLIELVQAPPELVAEFERLSAGTTTPA
jgi:lactoylglutathione lyase